MPFRAPEKQKTYNATYRALHREEIRSNNARYRIGNRDKLKAYNAKRYASKAREMLVSRYGISLSHFDAMLLAQDGKCKICRSAFTKTPCIDHDHKTGNARGLLCRSCNQGLGHFTDSTALLLSAIEYLKEYA